MTGDASGPAGRPGLPVVALLAAHWGTDGEAGWITRQVAGALSHVADVHIVTPDGPTAGSTVDSVFTLHRLGTPVATVDERARDLLVQAFRATGTADDVVGSPEVAALLDRGVIHPWSGAAAVLDRLRPDRVVIAGHRNVGALEALDRCARPAPHVLLALASAEDGLDCPRFDALVDRASSILAVTEAERATIVRRYGRPDDVRRVGAPLAANPSARSEPNPWVGDTQYVLVLSDVSSEIDHVDNDLGQLIRMRFPDRPVGISSADAFCTWHHGRLSKGWPIERSSDLSRLFAFAGVTVDFRPGGLFARRALESLLFGTPIVVPHGSRAADHARLGRAGLWFADPVELVGCVAALLDPANHAAFAAQGRAYAEAGYGSTGRFIDRVTEACGLAVAARPVEAIA